MQTLMLTSDQVKQVDNHAAEATVLRAVPGQYSLVCANFSSAISAKSITVGWDWKF